MIISKYKIYFTIYGKKMQTIIEAESEFDAECQLRNKIAIDKVETLSSRDDGKEPHYEDNDILNTLKDIFNFD